MNKLTKMINDSYQPKMAVVVYECSDPQVGLYLEHRPITNGRMGAGIPLTKKCVASLINAIAIDEHDYEFGLHGEIPANLLYSDSTPGKLKLVWYNPPEQRQLYFASSLGIKDGKMWIPGLVYVAEGGRLRIYAFKGNKPKSKLYRAPFMNVNEESVCLGNARVSKPTSATFSSHIAYWEKMFWESEFSHLLGDNPIQGNLATLSKELIESAKPFPNSVLIPSKYTLKSLLK